MGKGPWWDISDVTEPQVSGVEESNRDNEIDRECKSLRLLAQQFCTHSVTMFLGNLMVELRCWTEHLSVSPRHEHPEGHSSFVAVEER